MVTGRLWTNATSGGTFGGPYDLFHQFAVQFTTGSVGYVDELSYWTDSLAGDHQPTGLRLWNLTDGLALATVTPIPPPSITGWQRFSLDNTPQIVNGKTYAIGGWYNTSHGGYRYEGTTPTPESPLSFTSVTICGSLSSTDPPTGSSSEPRPFLDVRYNEVGSGITTGTTTPATSTDVGTAVGSLGGTFPQWLSSDSGVNTHQSDGLPWQTLQHLLSTQSDVSDIKTMLTANMTGFSGTFGGLTLSGANLKSAILGLLGLASDIITGIGFLRGLFPTGHTPSDHDASLEAHRAATEPEGETLPSYIEGEIEIVLSAVTDQTNEITQILAHGDGTEDVPTIVGESDWSNIFRFDVPADFYTIDIIATDADAVPEDIAGTSVWDHLGFCIPLTVDGLPEYGPRLAIGAQVIRTGRQMGGIILNGRRVLSGHVTAYQYQPA